MWPNHKGNNYDWEAKQIPERGDFFRKLLSKKGAKTKKKKKNTNKKKKEKKKKNASGDYVHRHLKTGIMITYHFKQLTVK